MRELDVEIVEMSITRDLDHTANRDCIECLHVWLLAYVTRVRQLVGTEIIAKSKKPLNFR